MASEYEDQWRRDDSWTRSKRYVGMGEPGADKDGWEKWPRFCAEIPPELAEQLDRAQRRNLGADAMSATRAGAVRAGLRMYLEHSDPEPQPYIDSEADEIPVLPELGTG